MPNVQPNQTLIITVVAHPELIPDGDIGLLLELLENAEFMPTLLERLGTQEQQLQYQNFEDKGATFDEPWKPNSREYDLKKLAAGYGSEQGVRTTRLAAEVGETMVMYGDSIVVGTNVDEVPYAGYFDSKRALVAITDNELPAFLGIVKQFIGSATGGSAMGIEVRSEIQ